MSKFVSLETEVESLLADSLAKTANVADLKDFHRLLRQCSQRLLRGRQASQKEDWIREIALIPLR